MLTEDEYANLKQNADKEFMTVSGYTRKVLVENGKKDNSSD